MFHDRNFGLCDDWKHVGEREDLQELIQAQKVPVINFPKFSYRERDLLDATRINFSQAFLTAELGVLGQQRLHSFLKKAHEEISKAQVWNVGQSAANKLSLDVATCNTNCSNLQSRHFQTRIKCNYNCASARINCN